MTSMTSLAMPVMRVFVVRNVSFLFLSFFLRSLLNTSDDDSPANDYDSFDDIPLFSTENSEQQSNEFDVRSYTRNEYFDSTECLSNEEQPS